VAAFEYAVWELYPELLSWPGRVVMAAFTLFVFLFFFGAVFSTVRVMQDRLERQNRELLALQRATIDIHGELSLDVILQKVVDQARHLLNARYGAVTVIDDTGRLLEFHSGGIDEATERAIGEPPVGHGLLGVTLYEGQRLRLADLRRDPRSQGSPEHHPEMRSLLAVPIECKSPFRGNLYVSEKSVVSVFSVEDEETLARFAIQAALAIDSAHLHQQLRSLAIAEERARIAREMHDGMAQVLAYVNTKAQAAEEHLRRGRFDRAADQLKELSGAAREVYTEVREGILALRTTPAPGESMPKALMAFVHRWEEQSGVKVNAEVDEAIDLSPAVELQLLRVIQEALSNVRKHSGAKRVELVMQRLDTSVEAMVQDEGRGFDPEALDRRGRPRFGLAIMHERAESVGGELNIDSEPGNGTTVRIRVPVS
jgi:signal transduction histidine kinase